MQRKAREVKGTQADRSVIFWVDYEYVAPRPSPNYDDPPIAEEVNIERIAMAPEGPDVYDFLSDWTINEIEDTIANLEYEERTNGD